MGLRLERVKYNMCSGPYWEETDYTGRWKIKCEDGECALYIECFHIEVEDSIVVAEGYTRKYCVWPFRWYRDISEVREKLAIPKVKAKVYWVLEDYLRLVEEPKEYINQCGSIYSN